MADMTTRVLVTLTPGADDDQAISALRGLSPVSVRPPTPELPGVAVAEVDDQDVDAFIGGAVRVVGVAHAERDVFSFTEPLGEAG